MSQREGQDLQPGYMDGVCVKISEKYKPPPRINLAITYAQRLFLNKQIQDNAIPYEFSLEKTIKHRVRELRSTRKQLQEEKKDRLEKLKEARLRHEKKILQEKSNDACSESKESLDLIEGEQVLNASGMIYPSSYSHILTPTLLSNTNTSQPFDNGSNDQSPFNISDFDTDTSSPFDNMELKTINDIEELAQVLKKEEATNNTFKVPYTNAPTQLYSNYAPLPSTSTQSTVQSNYNIRPPYSTYNPSTTFVHPIPLITSKDVNGYYYNCEAIKANANHNMKYYNYLLEKNDCSAHSLKESKNNFKSVPDIMKALETELDNTHISKNGASIIQENLNKIHPIRSRESENEIKSVDLGDVYDLLPKNLQYLSRDISSMGFPLPRVARACRALGDDHKKVVEHLLAMSELLDLGFLESDVSQALLRCDNDRDKALDILIS